MTGLEGYNENSHSTVKHEITPLKGFQLEKVHPHDMFFHSLLIADKGYRYGRRKTGSHRIPAKRYSSAGLLGGDRKGLYQKHGVDAESCGHFQSRSRGDERFCGGRPGYGICGRSARHHGRGQQVAKATVLAQVNTEGSAIMVKKGSAIKNRWILREKPLPSPAIQRCRIFCCRKPFMKFKVDPGKVSIIVLKPPEMIGALKTGSDRCVHCLGTLSRQSADHGCGRGSAHIRKIWKNHPCCVLIADDGFSKPEPERCSRPWSGPMWKRLTLFIKIT
jgi:hypothetical protein